MLLISVVYRKDKFALMQHHKELTVCGNWGILYFKILCLLFYTITVQHIKLYISIKNHKYITMLNQRLIIKGWTGITKHLHDRTKRQKLVASIKLIYRILTHNAW